MSLISIHPRTVEQGGYKIYEPQIPKNDLVNFLWTFNSSCFKTSKGHTLPQLLCVYKYTLFQTKIVS